MGIDRFWDAQQDGYFHRNDYAKLVAWAKKLAKNAEVFPNEPQPLDYGDDRTWRLAHRLWEIEREAVELIKPFNY